jgi:hypothetical protein
MHRERCVSKRKRMERCWKPTFAPPAPLSFHAASPARKAHILLACSRFPLDDRKKRSPASSSGSENIGQAHRNLTAPELAPTKQLKLFGGEISVEVSSLFSTQRSDTAAVTSQPTETKKKERTKKPKVPRPTEESIAKFFEPKNPTQPAVPIPQSNQAPQTRVQETVVAASAVAPAAAPAAAQSTRPEDFKGIETFCRNAGSSPESLQAIATKCESNETISLAFLWADGTSTHSVTSTKLCTPSRTCGSWNCSCDRNTRSQLVCEPPLGALLLLGDDLAHPYFLPLGERGISFLDISLCLL